MTDKKLIIFVAIGIILSVTFMSFAYNNNAQKNKGKPKSQKNINITINIDYPEDVMIKDYEKKKFKIPVNSTVLDAINLYSEASNMPLEFDKEKENVININNILNGDFYDTSYWTVKVNDKKCDGSLSTTKLNEGDRLQLVFIEK